MNISDESLWESTSQMNISIISGSDLEAKVENESVDGRVHHK